MNHDDATWHIMGQTFCSYKVKPRSGTVRFCRNPYNVTGLCQRGVCPLSQPQYATVIEESGELYLYVKTAERAHLPRRLWEKTLLSSHFPTALQQVEAELQWWDSKMVNKVKARLMRLTQIQIRVRRAKLEEEEVEVVSVQKRQEDKLRRREEKAEAAARIEMEVERELLERLRKGTYDGVINCNQKAFEKLMDEEEDRDEIEELENAEDEEFPDFVMEDDDEEEEEYEREGKSKEMRLSSSKGKTSSSRLQSNKKKREKLIIEEEHETAPPKKYAREDLDW